MTEKLTRDDDRSRRESSLKKPGGSGRINCNDTDQIAGLSQNGGGNLGSDELEGSMVSSRAWEPRRPSEESPRMPCAATSLTIRIAAMEPVLKSAVFGRPAGLLIRLMGLERVLSCRSGSDDIADQIEQVSTGEATAMAVSDWRGRKAFYGHCHRRQCHRRLAPGRTIGTWRDRCHRSCATLG